MLSFLCYCWRCTCCSRLVLFVYALYVCSILVFFFFKQKTAYEMRISDWSSDVCSSDLRGRGRRGAGSTASPAAGRIPTRRRSPRGRVCGPASPCATSRSEERRGGKECVSTCSSRWSSYH